MTPLGCATYFGNVDIMALLMEYGAISTLPFTCLGRSHTPHSFNPDLLRQVRIVLFVFSFSLPFFFFVCLYFFYPCKAQRKLELQRRFEEEREELERVAKQQHFWEELYTAVDCNRLDEAKRILAQDPWRAHYWHPVLGHMPIHLAARKGSPSNMVEILIPHSGVDLRSRIGRTGGVGWWMGEGRGRGGGAGLGVCFNSFSSQISSYTALHEARYVLSFISTFNIFPSHILLPPRTQSFWSCSYLCFTFGFKGGY